MPIFDLAQQRMCVRVVYDGIASAGKTTNLKHLSEVFATQRATEVHSPADARGRTLYFDWVQIATGVVCGFPLLCQVISVPGQVVLTPRRRHLLGLADAVVYVCDSAEPWLPRARDGLAVFDEVARDRGEAIPLVIQANKQDQSDAVAGPEVLRALGLEGVAVIEAMASHGVGVVDTFVAAVRSIVRTTQERMDRKGLSVPVRRAGTANELLSALEGQEVDPEWAAEMLLEELSDAMLMEGEAREAREPEPVSLAPVSLSAPASSGVRLRLPGEDVPTGFIWPAHTGRAALSALARESGLNETAPIDARGSARRTVADRRFETSLEWRFDDAETARQALVRTARVCAQLGSLLVPETVLVVQRATDGSSFLWRVVPVVQDFEAWLRSAPKGGLDTATRLDELGRAIVEALRIGGRHGLALDPAPSMFGVHGGALRYLGDIAAASSPRRSTPDALLDAVGVVDGLGFDVEPLLSGIERAIATKLAPEDLDRSGLSGTFGHRPRSATVAAAGKRLATLIARAPRAA